MVSLSQLDRNGMMDINSLLEIAANSIDPLMADKILQPVEQAQEQIREQLTEVSRAEEKIEDSDTKGKRSILIQSELSRPLKRIETHMRKLAAESNNYASQVSLMLFWNAVKQGRSKRRSLDDLIEKTSIQKEYDTKLDKHMTAVTKTLQMGESSHERIMQTWVEKIE